MMSDMAIRITGLTVALIGLLVVALAWRRERQEARRIYRERQAWKARALHELHVIEGGLDDAEGPRAS